VEVSNGYITCHITAIEPGIALLALLCVLRLTTGHEDLLGTIGIALFQCTPLFPCNASREHLSLRFLQKVVSLHRIFGQAKCGVATPNFTAKQAAKVRSTLWIPIHHPSCVPAILLPFFEVWINDPIFT